MTDHTCITSTTLCSYKMSAACFQCRWLIHPVPQALVNGRPYLHRQHHPLQLQDVCCMLSVQVVDPSSATGIGEWQTILASPAPPSAATRCLLHAFSAGGWSIQCHRHWWMADHTCIASTTLCSYKMSAACFQCRWLIHPVPQALVNGRPYLHRQHHPRQLQDVCCMLSVQVVDPSSATGIGEWQTILASPAPPSAATRCLLHAFSAGGWSIQCHRHWWMADHTCIASTTLCSYKMSAACFQCRWLIHPVPQALVNGRPYLHRQHHPLQLQDVCCMLSVQVVDPSSATGIGEWQTILASPAPPSAATRCLLHAFSAGGWSIQCHRHWWMADHTCIASTTLCSYKMSAACFQCRWLIHPVPQALVNGRLYLHRQHHPLQLQDIGCNITLVQVVDPSSGWLGSLQCPAMTTGCMSGNLCGPYCIMCNFGWWEMHSCYRKVVAGKVGVTAIATMPHTANRQAVHYLSASNDEPTIFMALHIPAYNWHHQSEYMFLPLPTTLVLSDPMIACIPGNLTHGLANCSSIKGLLFLHGSCVKSSHAAIR